MLRGEGERLEGIGWWGEGERSRKDFVEGWQDDVGGFALGILCLLLFVAFGDCDFVLRRL